MSETKHSDTIITNEQTLSRRAWIDRARESVRGTFEPECEAGESAERPARPRLYVVKSNNSG